MYTLETTDCKVKNEAPWNKKFKVRKGAQFLSREGLRFTQGLEKPDGSYKTVFGPVFWHAGQIYRRNNHNMSAALHRLTAARKPELPGYHELLMENQKRCRAKNKELARIIRHVSLRLRTLASPARTFLEECHDYVEQAKSKRQLKRHALAEILANGEAYVGCFTRLAEGNVKPEEWAKFGKNPRLFLNLGLKSSHVAGFAISAIKDAFGDPDGHTEFIQAPDKTVLARVFSRLIEPLGVYFPYFSDDSCLSIRCRDGVYMANVDISSCDGSHTDEVFHVLRALVDATPYMRWVGRAIDQCRLPLKLSSRVSWSKEALYLLPLMYILYSGSVLTTVMNNIANLMIFCEVKRRLRAAGCSNNVYNILKADCPDLVKKAAESAGYVVTVDTCRSYHDLQFLKHSPCLIGDEVIPVQNLGVILRMLGSCFGDLPGDKRLSMPERAYIWNQTLVQALCHAGTHSLTECLRQMYNAPLVKRGAAKAKNDAVKRVTRLLEYKNLPTISSRFVPDDEILVRYRLQPGDMQELLTLLRQHHDGHGVVVECGASRKILLTDYGL